MNTELSFTDPGALLGKTFLKIGQVFLAIMAIGSGYIAYLASEGLFSDWDIEVDSDLTWLFPSVRPDEWIFYVAISLSLKFLLWLGILAWLERKI
ncbi:hypothetical protein D0X99_03090 [Algoriphagus lacus]|uniref:Uncharacterized protein n=1 Tax=Algoriphagus lacus TaxID=2056311 RepID=A0A418PX93_9BACT|nr:hypothetical protein [Algoriphagus lacus]RIW18683.1 hypothetical protein D0X99_03090 [Algoriphagus lacus]